MPDSNTVFNKESKSLNGLVPKENFLKPIFFQNILGFFFVLSGLLLLNACKKDKVKNIPDVSNIVVDLEVSRFEKDLFSLDTNQISEMLPILEEKYPDFLKPVFLGKILPPLQDPAIFSLFVRTKQVRQLFDTCNIVFSDFDQKTIPEFKKAFQFYKYHFPKRKIPRLVTYLSEYTLGNFTLEEDMLGLGLDFFLGPNYTRYNPSFFPQYIQRSMTKEHLVSKSMFTLVKSIAGEPSGDRLIDQMIHNGKILYILDQLLPHTPDRIKLEYAQAQVEWCEENEQQIWAYFLKEDLLYSTKRKDIRKLIDHSPNSPGMPEEAPGRTANWIAWQMIKSYMTRYPTTSLEELIQLDDAQKIMEKSKYKPQR